MSTKKNSETPKPSKPRAPRKPRTPKTTVDASKAVTEELAVRKASSETPVETKTNAITVTKANVVSKDENGGPGIALKVFIALILILFYVFGYIHNSADSGPNLWTNVHPTTGADILGTALFTFAALAIGGFLGRTLAAAKWYPIAVAVVGVIGIILIFA